MQYKYILNQRKNERMKMKEVFLQIRIQIFIQNNKILKQINFNFIKKEVMLQKNNYYEPTKKLSRVTAYDCKHNLSSNGLVGKKTLDRSKTPKSHSNEALTKEVYFCHYKNAMYMGGVKVFQKAGRGIIIHDNGTTVVSSFINDMYNGENIFFLANGAIISADFHKGKLMSAVYKNQGILFYVGYKNEVPDGTAILVNFIKCEIVYGSYRNGRLMEKCFENNHEKLTRVFEGKNLQLLIPLNHAKNINLQFSKIKDVEIMKRGTKFTMGFVKNGLLNGLGFTLTNRLNERFQAVEEYNTQLIERGYYKNSQLNGFGQRRFKNGNIYIGEFKSDVFQGLGILKNLTKKNWVSGQFERGNLTELLKYNNQNEGEQKAIGKVLQSIHQKKTTWVNKEIGVMNELGFQKQIQKMENFSVDEKIKTLQNRKQEVLRRIQENFIVDNHNNPEQEYSKRSQLNLKVPKFMDMPSRSYLANEIESENRYRAQLETELRMNTSRKEDEKSSAAGSRIRKSKIFDNPYQQIQQSENELHHQESLTTSRKNKIFDSTITKNNLLGSQFSPQKLRTSRQKREQDFSRSPITILENRRIEEYRQPQQEYLQKIEKSTPHQQSKTLTYFGPRTKIFTPTKFAKEQIAQKQKSKSKSPNFVYLQGRPTSDHRNLRTQTILDSMYKRQLKKQLL